MSVGANNYFSVFALLFFLVLRGRTQKEQRNKKAYIASATLPIMCQFYSHRTPLNWHVRPSEKPHPHGRSPSVELGTRNFQDSARLAQACPLKKKSRCLSHAGWVPGALSLQLRRTGPPHTSSSTLLRVCIVSLASSHDHHRLRSTPACLSICSKCCIERSEFVRTTTVAAFILFFFCVSPLGEGAPLGL